MIDNMKKLILLSIFLVSSIVGAQVDSTQVDTKKEEIINNAGQSLNLRVPKVYTLADLEISGGVPYTKRQILRFVGLQIGDKIEVPGTLLNNAIKKLWRQKLFSDVELFATKVVNDSIYLRFNLVGIPSINNVEIQGVKKAKAKEFIKDNNLKKGVRITENLMNQTRINIQKYFIEKGFPDAKVSFIATPSEEKRFANDVVVKVEKGSRVKIKNILFSGNDNFSAPRLRRKGLKETKRRSVFRRSLFQIFKSSKYIPGKFDEDLNGLVDFYKGYGFRDMKVSYDSVTRLNKKNYLVKIGIDEGARYFLGDVSFVGNSVYPTDFLERVFSYKKGDPYDATGIAQKLNDPQKDDNILTLYQNNGYLFADVTPIEKSVKNDTINLEVRIREGEQASWNRVSFNGNTQTHDHVITRELYTRPGELFSKSDIKRTYMKLGQLGFFDPQQITQDIVPNQETNTVDIDWGLAPKSSSQIELQGGYGGGRFIGTLGLTFGNFSIGNLLKGKAWKPVPLGDGQSLSLRAQAGSYYSNYSISFTEPWIGGSRPTALTVSIYNSNYNNLYSSSDSKLTIWGASVGLSKLLTWPDDYFRLSNTLSYQRYDFDNYAYNLGTITYSNGQANNFAYEIGLSRLSSGPDPIFPTSGSEFRLSLKATPPYSLFSNKDYAQLKEDEDFEGLFKWVEYYKVKFSGDWYKELAGKLVLRTGAEFGMLGAYNKEIGISPFERFYMGGTGLQSSRFDGREIITLRGYEDFSNSGGSTTDITPEGGGVIYNKFLMELRYPITMGQQAKIYALSFLEAGNTWADKSEFEPFELKRSAGFGIRVFMSAFGMLGFDFGYGFDDYPTNPGEPAGWQTHFIFGQQL